MREMDALGLKICSFQAELFEKTIEQTNCSSSIFIRRFMNSKLAKRMDHSGFVFESIDVVDAIKEVEFEYGTSQYGKIQYSVEELYWIGYIYRYWAYVSDITSKQLYKIIKPEELRKLYLPYHSLDPMQAIERMMETKKITAKDDLVSIERGVLVLRKIRNKNK